MLSPGKTAAVCQTPSAACGTGLPQQETATRHPRKPALPPLGVPACVVSRQRSLARTRDGLFPEQLGSPGFTLPEQRPAINSSPTTLAHRLCS